MPVQESRVPPPSRKIDVSAVVVNWNTRDLLLRCIGAIERQDVGPLTSEVVLVDNASTDGSVETFRPAFPAATVIQNPRPMGFTKAVNQGFAQSRGRYVLLVSPDAEMLGKDGLARMIECLEANPEAGMVAPRYVFPDGSFQSMYNDFPTLTSACVTMSPLIRFGPARRLAALRRYFLDDMDFERIGVVPQPGVACVLIRRSAAEVVGPWDEQFPVYFSDVDWCLRLARAGFKILYLPTVDVIHLRGAATRKMGEQQWMHSAASAVRYFRKHKGPLQTWAFRAALVSGVIVEKGALRLGQIRHGERMGPLFRARDVLRAMRGEFSGGHR